MLRPSFFYLGYLCTIPTDPGSVAASLVKERVWSSVDQPNRKIIIIIIIVIITFIVR